MLVMKSKNYEMLLFGELRLFARVSTFAIMVVRLNVTGLRYTRSRVVL